MVTLETLTKDLSACGWKLKEPPPSFLSLLRNVYLTPQAWASQHSVPAIASRLVHEAMREVSASVAVVVSCLLYTSDAADDWLVV